MEWYGSPLPPNLNISYLNLKPWFTRGCNIARKIKIEDHTILPTLNFKESDFEVGNNYNKSCLVNTSRSEAGKTGYSLSFLLPTPPLIHQKI